MMSDTAVGYIVIGISVIVGMIALAWLASGD